MKFKIISVLFACVILILASCGDSSDGSDKKDNSTEQAGVKKQNHIKKLMSEYTVEADEVVVMLETEQKNDDKVQELYEQYIATDDEALGDEIDMQIENLEAAGDEISEKVMDLMEPLKEKEQKIEEMFEDLSAEQQKIFNTTKNKIKTALSL
jgi:hypothetical protein